MDELISRTERFMLQEGMLKKGMGLAAGVSGGPDSVCLLRILCALRETWDLRLTAVHVHHGLRGDSADRDMSFTQALCDSLHVPCRVFRGDVRAMAEEKHLSEEEAGRDFRYACFEQVLEETGADRIALAHHRDDAAETVLFNLCRGSGIRGLSGIPAVRGVYIRPLLFLGRKEILDAAAARGWDYRMDETNLEAAYTRNRIRLKAMPLLEEIHSGAGRHMAETARILSQIEDYLSGQAAGAVSEVSVKDADGVHVDIRAFRGLHPALAGEVIRQILGAEAGRMRDIGTAHITAVLGLFESEAGRRVFLPYGLTAVRAYETVDIRKEALPAGEGTAMPLSVPGTFIWPEADKAFGGRRLTLSLLTVDKKLQIPKNRYTKWFDYDRIGSVLMLRNRRTGDFLRLPGGSHKALRRVMIDDRMPRDRRDTAFLLADGSHVIWLPALDRISEYYKVTEKTARILAAVLEEEK